MTGLLLLSPTPVQAFADASNDVLDSVASHWGFLLFDRAFAVVDPMDVLPRTAVGLAAPVSSPSLARLTVVAFDSTRRTIVGRSAQKADVVVKDAAVSGAHAAIQHEDGQLWLTDLASSNGTFLGAHCLAPGEAGRVELRSGATLSLGPIELRFFDKPGLRRLLSTASL